MLINHKQECKKIPSLTTKVIMEEKFLKLIEENKSRLIRICMFYERSSYIRKDLYQEIIFQIWKSLKTFNNKSDIKTWLYRVAINTAITFKRKSKKGFFNKSLDEFYKIKDETNLEYKTEDQELLQLLHNAIKELNKIEQTIILLFLEGFNYKEIGDVTGLTENNIGVKMSRIKCKLKELIEVE